MTRITFQILTLFLLTITSCSGQKKSNDYKSCDVELRFDLDRNTSIQFYDSTGNDTWKWDNDSLDFIYAYFHANASIDDLVKIDSIMILNGGNQNNSEGWELGYVKGNETIEKLEGSWIKLSECEAELSEWMLYGNYEDHLTPYIFESPDTNSTKTQFDPRKGWTEHEVRVLAVQGNWFKVELTLENNTKIGWMPSYNLCSHPHTTCN
ncbi:hypothetical protein [Echinicola salinicaeni]|uniref:hypothetical protein n=1 Tax=Echinicola salinicaeni TaxID=2762757 RepID=UPI00164462A4|nr:hypothetical protein [Echinicola salinicaeni]